MTAALQVLETGLNEALLKIDGLANAPTHELADGIGRLVQEQTRRRIQEEKTSPAGEAWKPNSTGTAILFRSGTLAQSIDYIATQSEVQVGSGLVYARIHQDGGQIVAKNAGALAFSIGGRFIQVKSVTMPKRKYLGLSTENRDDVVDAAEAWVSRLLQ
ncbi:virion morphogenesis protein [Ensifer adhaerens]|nr:virion morphogenesis protein [Ensifer adhaerens]